MVLKTEDYFGMKKRIAVCFLVFCALFLIAACASQSSIVGKWRSDVYSEAALEFRGDGTLVAYLNDQAEESGTYRTEGDKIIITQNGVEQTGSFKIEGNKLTLIGPENQTDIFTRE